MIDELVKNNYIYASDLNSSLAKMEYSPSLDSVSVVSRGGKSYKLYVCPNLSPSPENSSDSPDLMASKNFSSSISELAPSSHKHSLSAVEEFSRWSITQNSSKDIVFDVYSPTTWTEVSNSKFGTTSISGVCYGNGKFVAVGGSGKMAYSTDGVTWTEVDSPFGSSSIYSVCYGNGKFVAGGGGGKLAYSSDGITWTKVVDSPFISKASIESICYGNGKFVAVGGHSSYQFGGIIEGTLYSGHIAYSTDGITWTRIDSSPFKGYYIYSICYGNGKFVAGGGNPSRTITQNHPGNIPPTITTIDARAKMAYSTDGITWTEVDSTFGGSEIYSICYGNGKFVAGGKNGKMARSEVGTCWVSVSKPKFGSSAINGVCYGNGKFVAFGSSGKMAYSTDAINWTETSSPFPNNFSSVCYGNGKFVAVGGSGKIAYSVV